MGRNSGKKMFVLYNSIFFPLARKWTLFFKKVCEKWKAQYASDEKLNSYIKQMTALALIPPNEVADAFVEFSLHLPDYDLDYFLDYLTIYYIDDGMFPIDSWNHYNNDGPRTNNHIEGYN